ncbi:MAG: hypothetical protein PHI11_09935 [Gallionella sp.]|nr:hypothetical protein [Gallionella sp.]
MNIRWRNKLKISTALLCLLGLVACGGSTRSMNLGDTIYGIHVPPMPNSVTNQATLAGIDSDGNGIRDDIDRKLAIDFGSTPADYRIAVNHARTLQAALVIAGSVQIADHASAVSCAPRGLLMRLKSNTLATLNTPERGAAYGAAFAGVLIKACR